MMKVNKALLAVASAALLFVGCAGKNNPKNFSVVTYVNVTDDPRDAKNYVFDGTPLLEYEGSFFRHVDSATYLNNKIEQIDLYKPTSIYSIPRKDLMKDTLLLASFNASQQREIKMEEGKMTDNGTELQGKLMKEGQFAVVKGLYLYMYTAIEK